MYLFMIDVAYKLFLSKQLRVSLLEFLNLTRVFSPATIALQASPTILGNEVALISKPHPSFWTKPVVINEVIVIQNYKGRK